MSTDARIEELEIKVAHLERTLQELGDVLYRQQRQIDAMQARYESLVDRVEATERRGAEPGGFEIPPHY